ncbi:hypothetical protein PSEUDO8Z_190024 [Pseudomonas sp. 8Z]|nr:hypothetical protein PSEUDO8Z_190024 [Pseudomonas sp. 8Z]
MIVGAGAVVLAGVSYLRVKPLAKVGILRSRFGYE